MSRFERNSTRALYIHKNVHSCSAERPLVDVAWLSRGLDQHHGCKPRKLSWSRLWRSALAWVDRTWTGRMGTRLRQLDVKSRFASRRVAMLLAKHQEQHKARVGKLGLGARLGPESRLVMPESRLQAGGCQGGPLIHSSGVGSHRGD